MSYRIKKTVNISASHRLELNHESPCKRLHGHNWKIVVYCKSEELDGNGMVVDFATISGMIKVRMDHKDLNEMFNFNPTAENIARFWVDAIEHCYKCKVIETDGSEAVYEC